MTKKPTRYCRCRDCKRMRRKGFILGSLRYGYRASAYVLYHKFIKGRGRKEVVYFD